MTQRSSMFALHMKEGLCGTWPEACIICCCSTQAIIARAHVHWPRQAAEASAPEPKICSQISSKPTRSRASLRKLAKGMAGPTLAGPGVNQLALGVVSELNRHSLE